MRGPILIHAGKEWDTTIARWMDDRGLARTSRERAVHGAIVGAVEIVDCTQEYCGIWSSFGAGGGPYMFHWQLANAVEFEEPIPCRGAQGWWEPPESILPRLPGDIIPTLSARRE